MGVFAVDAYAEVTKTGAPTGSVWATVPPSAIQHFVGLTSIGMAQSPVLDFSPSGNSAGATLPSCTLSVGGDLYVVPLGSVASAIYTDLLGRVTRENWTRTS